MATNRRELRKVKKNLNDNKKWLCLENCKKKDPQCEICTMILLINHSYGANKKADILTFRNSYLYEPFEKVYEIYTKHQNKVGWNSFPEERKKEKVMVYGNSCLCM